MTLEEFLSIDLSEYEIEIDDDDWGCEYCRNDGALNDNGHCPKCDAEYPEEDEL